MYDPKWMDLNIEEHILCLCEFWRVLDVGREEFANLSLNQTVICNLYLRIIHTIFKLYRIKDLNHNVIWEQSLHLLIQVNGN